MDTLTLTVAILTILAEAGEEGMPSGNLYAFLRAPNIHLYQGIISSLVQADMLTDKNHVTRITYSGLIQAKRMLSALSHKGDTTMAKTEKAAETTETPKEATKTVVKFGPKKRAKLLAKALKRIPEKFMLKGKAHKDQIFSVCEERSTVSKKDGEITLRIFKDGTDPLAKDEEGAYATSPDVKTTPKGLKVIIRKIPKEKREGNIARMTRLLTEGKSMKEIVSEFSSLYTETGKEHKQKEEWIVGRVGIYANIAAKADTGAAEALLVLEKKAKKERIAKKKAKKAGAEAAEAESEETEEEGEAEAAAEAPAPKKVKGKKKAEA